MRTTTRSRPRSWWIPYLYYLRVQICTGLLLLAGPPLALVSPLFRGLFDLDHASSWRTITSVTLGTFAAFSAAWTLLATTWAAAYNAPDRFRVARIESVKYPITWPERECFAIFAVPTIAVSVGYSAWASRTPAWRLILGVVLGAIAAVAILASARWSADRLQRTVRYGPTRNAGTRAVRRAIDKLNQEQLRDGYIDPKTGELAPGHLLAVMVFASSVVLYVTIGIGKWLRLGYETNVSTLACVLLLVLMICWLAAGMTFFLDRYRVSLVASVGGVAFIIGLLQLPGSDHVYRTYPHPEDISPWPHQVLNVGSRTPILIAATGGGIQAASWTARVLTGIDAALPNDLRDAFTHSIRLFSTVSGGGVGAMYFSERYRSSGFDRRNLHEVVDKAEASTLDDVAWGATYPDALATFFPPVRAVFGDRGQALETAWTRSLEVGRLLSDWRTQVWSDLRPANIFNATLVDTGERVLLGTSRVGWREERGLRNFEEVYKNRDVQVVTAARLAASFAYVSPAARPHDSGEAYHIVDGGYYDDYGMTTLSEWLDEALEGVGDAREFQRVLVVQIRSDEGNRLSPPASRHWPLYQLWAPVETLLNVRSTSQISHNDSDFDRLQELWKERRVEIDNVIFRFCGEHPPLSWHLTGREKKAIETEWQAHTADQRPELRAVQAFLRGQPLPATTSDAPYQVPLTPCPPKP